MQLRNFRVSNNTDANQPTSFTSDRGKYISVLLEKVGSSSGQDMALFNNVIISFCHTYKDKIAMLCGRNAPKLKNKQGKKVSSYRMNTNHSNHTKFHGRLLSLTELPWIFAALSRTSVTETFENKTYQIDLPNNPLNHYYDNASFSKKRYQGILTHRYVDKSRSILMDYGIILYNRKLVEFMLAYLLNYW